MKHLLPSAAALLDRPVEERVAQLQKPSWIEYTQAHTVLEKLEQLLQHPATHRMPNLLLVGDMNNGKTMLIRRFVEAHPPQHDLLGTKRRVLLIQAPPIPDERRLYFAILDALKAPYSQSGLTASKMMQSLTVLKKVGVRMLIIDEIHHLMAGHLEKQRQFLNVLKYLSNELQIALVGVGIRDALRAVQTDAQLANRFEPAGLPRWSLDRDFRMLLMSFEQVLPLRCPSNLAGKELAPVLLAEAEGTIGELSKLLSMAAEAAIRSGQECIDQKLLKNIGWVRPSHRRSHIEGMPM